MHTPRAQRSARPRRVSVVGNSGSGKTTAARAVARRLGVPHLELDGVFHQPGWTPLPDVEFRARVAEFVAADDWVVDGNYQQVLDLVWELADTVIWLDLPDRRVMRQLLTRTLRRGVTRSELWNGNRESLRNLIKRNPEVNVALWSWRQRHAVRARYEAAAASAPAGLAVVRIASRQQFDRWIASLGASGPSGSVEP